MATRPVRLRRAFPFLLGALILAGCQGDGAPMAPESQVPGRVGGTQAGPATLLTVNGVQLVQLLPGERLVRGVTSQSVPALTGAVITNGDATLVVPPFSVPDGTTITLRSVRDGTLSFRFGPNRLRFRVPALLKISTAKANLLGIDLRRLAIAGASDRADDWTIIGGVYDPITGTVVAPISHFSRYALCVD